MKLYAHLTAAAAVLMLFSAPAWSHEVPNMEHSHAFQKKGYGQYRQGHYVNGPQGSIIIWSPNTVNSRTGKSPVTFARPTPITKPPSSPLVTRNKDRSEIKYGNR